MLKQTIKDCYLLAAEILSRPVGNLSDKDDAELSAKIIDMSKRLLINAAIESASSIESAESNYKSASFARMALIEAGRYLITEDTFKKLIANFEAEKIGNIN